MKKLKFEIIQWRAQTCNCQTEQSSGAIHAGVRSRLEFDHRGVGPIPSRKGPTIRKLPGLEINANKGTMISLVGSGNPGAGIVEDAVRVGGLRAAGGPARPGGPAEPGVNYSLRVQRVRRVTLTAGTGSPAAPGLRPSGNRT